MKVCRVICRCQRCGTRWVVWDEKLGQGLPSCPRCIVKSDAKHKAQRHARNPLKEQV